MASEDLKQLTYDFDFICQAFNLVPWREGAFNAGAIVNIHFDKLKNIVIELYNGHAITLVPEDMVELETFIKKCLAKQQGIIVGAPTGRKFRQ